MFLSVLDEERDDIGEDCRAVFADADLIEGFSGPLDIVDVPGIDPGQDQVAGDPGEDIGLMALAVEFVDQGKDCREPGFILVLAVEHGGTAGEIEYLFFCRFDDLA